MKLNGSLLSRGTTEYVNNKTMRKDLRTPEDELKKSIAAQYKILADEALIELKDMRSNGATPYQIKKQRKRYNSFFASWLKYS